MEKSPFAISTAQVVLIAEYGKRFRREASLVSRCSRQISYGYSVLSGFEAREVLCCSAIRPRIRVVGRVAANAQVKRAVGYVGGAGVTEGVVNNTEVCCVGVYNRIGW